MARGGVKKARIVVEPDPVYGSHMLAKFINRLMKDGKKTTAQRVVYSAFEVLESKGVNPLETFEKALDNIGPKVEVKARRIGGAAYQVPTEVRGSRRQSLAIRWLLEAVAKRPNSEYKTFGEKLAAEIIDASKGEGDAMRKKEVAHRMAEANKAFASFKW
ncbi:MAG TPA: 30S ribosomal protein S7 [Candidatus Levybacteria bacterium]|nr:30S ribosomal protein S7 [Candidatus Levybacteria bacterium]